MIYALAEYASGALMYAYNGILISRELLGATFRGYEVAICRSKFRHELHTDNTLIR